METLGYIYDADGRMAGMTRDTGGGPQAYASADYGPAGEMLHLSYAGVTETRTYNDLLQMTSQSMPGYMNMTYNYSATANNGRITSSADAMTGENVTYGYDGWNRLTSATETAKSWWSTGYTFDGFGNLLTKTGAGAASSTARTFTYDAGNHLSGVSFDANGNQTGDGVRNSTWTVENRLASTTLVGTPYTETLYGYDGSGKRIMKGVSGTNATFEYNFYGITGQRLVTIGCHKVQGQTLPGCSISGEDIYFKGKMLVSNGVVVATDRLGSVRQGTSLAYFPYGEERTSTADGRDKFGTYFRDGAGQDYADQRYFGADKGRFWSPDPSSGSGAGDPGSWSKYAYVQGDPINFLDPGGLQDVSADYWVICYNSAVLEEHPYTCSASPTPRHNLLALAMGPIPDGPAPTQAPSAALGDKRIQLDLSMKGQAAGAVQQLGAGCQFAFFDKGFNVEALLSVVFHSTFYSEYLSGGLKVSTVSGYVNPTDPNQTLSQYVGTARAGVLPDSSGGVGNQVILATSFFTTIGYGASLLQSQNITLVHEMLHVGTGQNDQQLFNFFNLKAFDQGTASSTISYWLSKDCPIARPK